jgi:hypothetical protein
MAQEWLGWRDEGSTMTSVTRTAIFLLFPRRPWRVVDLAFRTAYSYLASLSLFSLFWLSIKIC